MARTSVGFNVDTRSAQAVLGFIEGIAYTINTNQHISAVLNYSHSKMAEAFDLYMDMRATADPSSFHHVYEWGMVGEPQGRLWRNTLKGHGRTKDASWEWRASKKTVPVRSDAVATNAAGQPYGHGRPQQIHVFVWKAPALEYQKSFTIAPKRGKYIVYFTGPWSSNGEWYQHVNFATGPITVQNPGGEHVNMSFTKAFVEWWGHGGAETEFNTGLKQKLEHDLGLMRGPMTLVNRKFKDKTFNIRTITDAAAAHKVGAEAADKFIKALGTDYIRAAINRERMGMG